MTISLDSYNRTANITTNTTYTQGLTPSGTIIGVLFVLTHPAVSDGPYNVKYGGQPLYKIAAGLSYTGTNLSVSMWLLDRAVPQGTQNLDVLFGTGGDISLREDATVVGHTYFLAGTGGVTVADLDVKYSGGTGSLGANPTVSLDSGADTALRVLAFHTGIDDAVNHSLTSGYTSDYTDDWGSYTSRVGHETTPSSGAKTPGITCGDDAGVLVGVALIDGGADTVGPGILDYGGPYGPSTETTKTISLTIPTQPAALLFFATCVTDATDVLDSVTWDGDAMTEVHNVTASPHRTYSFYILNPSWDGSSMDFSLTMTGSGSASKYLHCYYAAVYGTGTPYLLDSGSIATASGQTYWSSVGSAGVASATAWAGMWGRDAPRYGWLLTGTGDYWTDLPGQLISGWDMGSYMSMGGFRGRRTGASDTGYTDGTSRFCCMAQLTIAFQTNNKRKQMLILG